MEKKCKGCGTKWPVDEIEKHDTITRCPNCPRRCH
jgi:hypothetical protein